MSTTPPSFPLTDRPWIPVVDRTGRTLLVSLRQLFAESEQFVSLTGELPTQVMAILRLLLAVLHSALRGPEDERVWHSLWQSARLPFSDIDSYLDEFDERFDLLHPRTPFYQVADLSSGRGENFGLERLILDVPNNEPYLTSRLGPALERISPAEAARWLVTCQAYDTSGIKTGAVGDPRVKGGRGYPIGPGLCGSIGGIFLEGRTIRETLLLNLIPYNVPYLTHDERDCPVWERPPQGPAEEPDATRGPFGRLSLYTWQSRRIRLFGDETAITGALVANGDKLEWTDLHYIEPMTAWRRNSKREKELKRSPVYLPALHDHTRALWRGLDALLPAAGASGDREGPPTLAPALAQWAARLRNAGYVERGFRVSTRAVGVAYGTQQAVVDEIYHDSLTLNISAFVATHSLAALIVDSARDADEAVKRLRRLAENLTRAAGSRGKDRTDPARAAADRAAMLAYAELDQHFRQWVSTLDDDVEPVAARTAWQQTVRRVVLDIGADLVTQAGPSAWVGRQVGNEYLSTPLAELWFRSGLNNALPLARPHSQPEPQQKQAQEVPV